MGLVLVCPRCQARVALQMQKCPYCEADLRDLPQGQRRYLIGQPGPSPAMEPVTPPEPEAPAAEPPGTIPAAAVAIPEPVPAVPAVTEATVIEGAAAPEPSSEEEAGPAALERESFSEVPAAAEVAEAEIPEPWPAGGEKEEPAPPEEALLPPEAEARPEAEAEEEGKALPSNKKGKKPRAKKKKK